MSISVQGLACQLPPAARQTAELWETRTRRERPDQPAPRAHAARTRRTHGAPCHISRHAEKRVCLHADREFSGAQTARLFGVRGVRLLNLFFRASVWLLFVLRGWATFRLNHKRFAITKKMSIYKLMSRSEKLFCPGDKSHVNR